MNNRFFLLTIYFLSLNLHATALKSEHTENEFSISLPKNSLDLIDIKSMYEFLYYKIAHDEYYFIYPNHAYIFFDIYLNASTRLRSRFKHSNKNNLNPLSWLKTLNSTPTRVEFQKKIQLNSPSDYSKAKELRYDIFSENTVRDYNLYKKYRNIMTNLFYKPNVNYLISQRRRLHISKKTKFGQGNNPDHIFLVSFDISYLIKKDIICGPHIEMEIELERNIRPALKNKEDLYFYKNKMVSIKNIILDYLNNHNIKHKLTHEPKLMILYEKCKNIN